jgi:hypothetical protein
VNDSAAIPTPPWNPPKPEQLPFLRLSLLDQLRNPLYQEEVARALASGLGTLHPLYGTPQEQAGALLYEERLRLNSAKMWSAGEEVVQLAVQAGQNLPTWKVRREDVLGPCGLLVFDAPIAQYVNTGDETVSIVAASWGPSDFLGDDQLWVTFWSVVNFDLLTQTVKYQLGCSMAEAREVARLYKVADLNWDNEVALTFNDHTIRLADCTDPVDPAAEQHMLSQTTTSWVQTPLGVAADSQGGLAEDLGGRGTARAAFCPEATKARGCRRHLGRERRTAAQRAPAPALRQCR